MMHQEKKYRVDSFDSIIPILRDVGAKMDPQIVTTHYYGIQNSKDVTKLVESTHGFEIHILKESNGKFSMADRVSVPDKKTGLSWLKDHGFTEMNIVKMSQTDYEYDGGIVGLYIINDFLQSVILDFPPDKHDTMAKLFGLESTEVIRVPYNIYLTDRGQLSSITLT